MSIFTVFGRNRIDAIARGRESRSIGIRRECHRDQRNPDNLEIPHKLHYSTVLAVPMPVAGVVGPAGFEPATKGL